ncbi:DUF4843 domain-containing protein [Arcticibacter tournemirensis]|nr:DUF4843 domain-containing protein [Arcticibacter tournemirensis]
MKRYFIYTFLLALFLSACKKNDISLYDSAVDNIYLNYLDDDGKNDTNIVTYSFAGSPGLASDTIWIPVAIAGKRVNRDRKFVLSVVDNWTTAQKDMHYEPLKPFYIMPADSGKTSVPLIIKNTDPQLANTSVTLTLQVIQSEDFASELPVAIRTKTFVYSNRLEQPSWWVFWMGNLGPYSRTSHRLFLISGGQDLVNPGAPDGYMGIPRTLYYLENVKNFTVDPFTWILRNPEKGYVLAKRNDGTEDYDFYQKESPLVKIHLKFFPQVNRYFFMNENGNQVIFN